MYNARVSTFASKALILIPPVDFICAKRTPVVVATRANSFSFFFIIIIKLRVGTADRLRTRTGNNERSFFFLHIVIISPFLAASAR